MPRSESLLAAAAPRSHQLPDPAFLDDANLAACHVAMLEERDRQAKLAEVATLHLRQARRELCRLRDALDRERRRRPGLSMAAALVLALAAFAGGFGLGMAPGPDGPVAAGELGSCMIRPELLHQLPQP